MAGWMRQTTTLIKSTIEEKRSFLVYWRSATSSKSWSATVGLRTVSKRPRAITVSGVFWANRSKTSPSIIAAGAFLSRGDQAQTVSVVDVGQWHGPKKL